MFNSSIKIDDENAKKILNGYTNKLIDLSYENHQAAQRAQLDIQQHFTNEESPVGKWKPSIRVKRFGGKTLTKSGKLRLSLQLAQAIKVDKISFSIGSDVEYAQIHNNGGKFKHHKSGKFVHMPKRQFAWLSAKAKEDITQIYIRGFLDVKG